MSESRDRRALLDGVEPCDLDRLVFWSANQVAWVLNLPTGESVKRLRYAKVLAGHKVGRAVLYQPAAVRNVPSAIPKVFEDPTDRQPKCEAN